MTLRAFAGWDHAKLGSATLSIQESGGGGVTAVSISSGKYCHIDLTDVIAYDDFATALKTALDAASPTAKTYTVSFSQATRKYSISISSGTVAITFASDTAGTTMKRLIGFTADHSTASSHASDIEVWGTMESAEGASSAAGPDELTGFIEESTSFAGDVYQVFGTAPVRKRDFEIRFEPRAATKTRYAATSQTHTWEDFWQFVRGQPFLIVDDIDSTVYRLRKEAFWFAPERSWSRKDYDGGYTLKFKCFVHGRL